MFSLVEPMKRSNEHQTFDGKSSGKCSEYISSNRTSIDS